MWTLDPANSPELFIKLNPHAHPRWMPVAWVGEGWRSLVEETHERLVAEFPDYELLAIKEKWGQLEFQANPRAAARGQPSWSRSEYSDLHRIADEISRRSTQVCEWCGSVGSMREGREHIQTLCDDCDRRIPDMDAIQVRRSTARDRS